MHRVVLLLFDCSDDEYSNGKFDFFTGIGEFRVIANTDFKEPFDSIFSDTKSIIEPIKNSINIMDAHNMSSKSIKEFLSEYDYYVKNPDFISLDLSLEDSYNYILKNPELKKRKILINEPFDISASEFISNVLDVFLSDTDNLYILVKRNSEPVKFTLYVDTIRTIEKYTNYIKQFHLSPFEEVMMAYDITRYRIYTPEKAGESYSTSRDLTSSLLGNSIVCLGYARIFDTILNFLGTKAEEVLLEDSTDIDEGHARCAAYIVDPKYNLDGVYFFDPTWDSKKDVSDNFYTYSYEYFALTKQQIDDKDNGFYIEPDFPNYYQGYIEHIIEQIKNNGIKSIKETDIRTINYMSKFILGRSLLSRLIYFDNIPQHLQVFEDEIIERLEELDGYFSHEISGEQFLEALINVRKNEYYNMPEEYPFDIESIYKIVIKSGWEISDTPEDRLIRAIFGDKNNSTSASRYINFLRNGGFLREINGVRLTRTLKNVYDKKQLK